MRSERATRFRAVFVTATRDRCNAFSCCQPSALRREETKGVHVKQHLALYSWNPMLRDEEGQTMAEYAVILAVIAIGVILAITALSTGIGNAIDKVTEILP